MPTKSFGFAIGNLRANENTLLKDSDVAQLLSCHSTGELAAMLRDKGFGSLSGQEDVPELLHTHTEALWAYLLEIAPDQDLFAPFVVENDFHNLKVVLKGIVRSRPYSNILCTPAGLEVSVLEQAVKEHRFDLLPPYMAQAATDAAAVLIENGDPQLSDGILDAACLAAQLSLARATKNAYIIELIESKALYANAKSAIRAARAQKDSAFLKRTLTDTPPLAQKELVAAAAAGAEDVLELLSRKGLDEAVARFRESPAAFERFADDTLIRKARRAKVITMGVEPIIGYLLARLAEIKTVRIIYSGIKTGADEDSIRERLRELYG